MLQVWAAAFLHNEVFNSVPEHLKVWLWMLVMLLESKTLPLMAEASVSREKMIHYDSVIISLLHFSLTLTPISSLGNTTMFQPLILVSSLFCSPMVPSHSTFCSLSSHLHFLTNSPTLLYPSCPHTTFALAPHQFTSHNVPYTPPWQISTSPSIAVMPPVRRTAPSVQDIWQITPASWVQLLFSGEMQDGIELVALHCETSTMFGA